MALSEALRAHLRSIVDAHHVVLFMKGTRLSPQCGFSATVVGILDAMLPAYHTVDVLADPAVRDGLKDFSEWPTFPQLYARGAFVGGADIVKELHARGELQAALGVAEATVKAPALHVTAKAAAVFREAAADADGLVLRLEVSSGFRYDLSFGDATPLDVVVTVADGLRMHLDPGSAYRADGTTIDYVVGAQGGGFTLSNPNEPAKVKQLSPLQLEAMLKEGKPLTLVDVRTTTERDLAVIEGSRLLDAALEHELLAMDRGAALVFQCHHGVRSLAAAEHFVGHGFREVYNLQGGIDGWSVTVDPDVPRY
jgi:monothiol glutaredoxin